MKSQRNGFSTVHVDDVNITYCFHTHTKKKKRTEGHVNALGTNSIACESFEALLLQSIIIIKKKKNYLKQKEANCMQNAGTTMMDY